MRGQGMTYKDFILFIGNVVTIIRELHIEEGIGQHGELQLIALIDAGDKAGILYEDEEEFAVFYRENDKVKALFAGIIMTTDIQAYGELYLLHMTARTTTYFMDVGRKKRIFQNPELTAHELLKLMMSIYQGSQFKVFIQDNSINELLVQYEETDWEFLKRFCSRYHAPVLAVCNGTGPGFMVGVPRTSEQLDWTGSTYEVFYQADKLHAYEKNTDIPINSRHGMSYLVTSYEIHSLGARVKINNEEMYISSIRRTLQDGILLNEYTLCYEEGFLVPKFYNQKMTGISIEGTVTKVNRNKIQVMTSMEGVISENRYWFPFSTVAASSDGSGWYCMPAVGEQIRIYFPVKDEKEAYTITSIKGYLPGAKAVISDAEIKNISANNKSVFFTGNSLVFDVDNQNGQLVIYENGEITLNASTSIIINAVEKIIFSAQNQLTFAAEKEINIANQTGGAISIVKGQIKIGANKIHFNPPIVETE